MADLDALRRDAEPSRDDPSAQGAAAQKSAARGIARWGLLEVAWRWREMIFAQGERHDRRAVPCGVGKIIAPGDLVAPRDHGPLPVARLKNALMRAASLSRTSR